MNDWLSVLGLIGYNSVGPILNTEPSHSLDNMVVTAPILRWRVDVTPDQENSTSVEYSAPNVCGNDVFIGLSHHTGLQGYNMQHGYRSHTVPTDASVQMRPTVHHNTMVVADLSGTVYAWDCTSFSSASPISSLWKTELKIPINTEIVVDESLLVVSTNGNVVYALNWQGEIVWRYEHRMNASRKGNLQLFGAAKPLLTEDIVFVGFSDGAVVSLDRTTGTAVSTAWNGAGRYPDIIAQPLQTTTGVVVSGFEQPTWQEHTGSVGWQHSFGATHSAVLLSENNGIYLVHPGSDGILRKIDSTTGTVIWEWDSGLQSALSTPVMLSDGNMLFSSSTGGMYIVDGQGTLVWQDLRTYSIDGIMQAPLVYGKQIFLLTKAGFLEMHENLSERQSLCRDVYCQWLEQ